MGDILISLLLMVICLIAEGFFSGSEIGVVSADRMKLRMDAAKGSRGAKPALAMLKKPEWLLSTTLVGTNIAVVTNTTVATALMIQFFGPENSWLAIVVVAPLIWVFGEIVPKSVFQQRADVITPKVISLLKLCSYLFYPILVVFSFLARWLSRAVGDKPERKNPFTLREEIMTMMQMTFVEGDIEPLEKTMIRRLFNFEETPAGQIMTPLIDVVSARVDLGSLSEELGIDLPEGKYASLAGFLLDKARDVPPAGAEIKYKAISFNVQRATPQAIQEVRIRW